LGDLPDPHAVAGLRAAHELVLEAVASACARTGRDPAGVQLVAVSKTVGVDRLAAALAAGLTLLGENRVQEAEAKASRLPGARWHLIGPLQSNKARRAAGLFEVIETVDSSELARRLDRLACENVAATGKASTVAAGGGGRPQALGVFIQVNIDRDAAKSGFLPEALEAELPAMAALRNLNLLGLMTVGRFVTSAEEARPTFVRLREISERLRAEVPSLGPGLSMGMSDDYQVAVEEGATVIRVGRAIFGERPAAGPRANGTARPAAAGSTSPARLSGP
jgi:pyridoxal phosphate enzyme (YggS family)